MNRPISAFLIGLLLFPFAAHAQVVVSEIMYDVKGADPGREWIEVFNAGGSKVDISSWKLFEGDTNHKIVGQSDGILKSGAYAIIADNVVKFLADHPAFAGQIFSSSFILNNTGETIMVRDAQLADRDSVAYTSAMGAAGNGDSLQRSSVTSGVFIAASSTPGAGALISAPPVIEAAPVKKQAAKTQPAKTELKKSSADIPVTKQKNAAVASTASPAPSDPHSIYVWWLSLAAIIAAGSVGAYFATRSNQNDWEIVEEVL